MSCYSAVYPTSRFANLIASFLEWNNIEGFIEMDDLHCTLIYDSRDTVDPMTDQEIPNRTYRAEVDGVGVLGDAVVIHLKSPDLQSRFKEITGSGYQSDFEDYLPHISMKYDPTDEDVKLLKSKLGDLKIILSGLTLTDERSEPVV